MFVNLLFITQVSYIAKKPESLLNNQLEQWTQNMQFSWWVSSALCVSQNESQVQFVLFVQLIFSDEEIHLSVSVIYVYGHMKIGAENCRILSDITITFEFPETDDVHFPDLGIDVKETGQLDIHGEKFSPTWTRLKSTAKAGTNYVSLQVRLSFCPAQSIQLSSLLVVWTLASHCSRIEEAAMVVISRNQSIGDLDSWWL